MVLSNFSIKQLLESGRLVIDPIDDKQIQPASVDLRLADEILISKGSEINFGEEPEYDRIKKDIIMIPPKTHVLVRTAERIELPNDVGGIMKLRSSLSRVGVILNNAGWVDPGFKGTLTLSVFNSNDIPVNIKAGTRFSQLILLNLSGESRGYSGKYINQKETTGSKAHLD